MYPYDLDAAGLSNREGRLCELKLWLPPPCLSLAGEAGRCSDPCGGLPLPLAQAVHGSRLISKPCCPLSHLKPWLVDTMHRTHKQPHLRGCHRTPRIHGKGVTIPRPVCSSLHFQHLSASSPRSPGLTDHLTKPALLVLSSHNTAKCQRRRYVACLGPSLDLSPRPFF